MARQEAVTYFVTAITLEGWPLGNWGWKVEDHFLEWKGEEEEGEGKRLREEWEEEDFSWKKASQRDALQSL
jgi:hypothetical protein